MSGNAVDDPLWPHFQPLWTATEEVAADNLLVAGGYGLFLKQRFLLTNPALPVVVSLDRWLDARPRVTKDLDLVIGLDLIAAEERHQGILNALERNGFQVSKRPSGKRWQFAKSLADSRVVLVELHAPRPENDHPGVTATDHRVKHKPSLGDAGIHGRTNPEAAGADLYPFRFEIDGINPAVVNPVTWSVMKLTAMDDRWTSSQNVDAEEETRNFAQQQALKYAQDVCRIVASMTRKERDTTDAICETLNRTPSFQRAALIWNETFAGEKSPPVVSARLNWSPEDFEIIRSVGSRWFV